MTTTLERPEGPPSARRYWRAPRRPVTIAVAVLLAVTAALWGLRWWGPINPELAVSWSSSNTETGKLTMTIENRSHSSFTVEAVELAPRFPVDGSTAEIGDLDVAIEPGATASVVAELPLCGGPPSVGSQDMTATVTVRNQAGWPVSTSSTLPSLPVCPGSATTWTPPPVELPAPGIQPADPVAARAGVTSAYWAVYDGSRPAPERAAAIDQPIGITELATAGPTTWNGADLTTLRSDVRAIVFDTPDHAWVDYGLALGLRAGPSQVGEAVLVDGTWKVARSTVCADLLLLDVHCPR